MSSHFSRRARRVLTTGVALTAAAILTTGLTGTAAAEIESSNQIVDSAGRTVSAIQADTRIDFVAPLDGNPLTREWFHHGRAGFTVAGPDAGNWSGRITLGYQVGYPATAGGKLKFEYSTPGLGVELGTGAVVKIEGLIPRGGIELEVGFGPGIQTVEVASGEISGTDGFLRVSGFHSTVTGVVGPTTIRPFVSVVGASGDTVVTYGPTWTT
ncbi:MspA family porin [Nocardia puris]|nr:MspA family porin [Nocardia puris]MBF6366444.1 MspA family porin [Nocardia puris]MBF6458217.1 MspA family porin [Nocardia puris]